MLKDDIQSIKYLRFEHPGMRDLHFPRRVESTIIHLQQLINCHSYASSILHSPPMIPRNRENLQIEPTKAKVPLSRMAVCALEVCAASLGVGGNIPTAAALIGNQRQIIVVCNPLHKVGIGLNGTETVGDGEG